MQSVQLKDVFAKSRLNLMARYSIYRDLKAKIGNLLVFVGYPVLIYFFVSLFTPLIPIYPYFSLSWYFSLVITIMMIERQISRSVAIYNVYGFRSMFFACLLPPILPIRIIWGNIINLTATIQAYIQSIKGNKGTKKTNPTQKSFAWSKTEHTFLPKDVLSRYKRTFGDVLIEKGILTPEELKKVLNKKPNNIQIGKYLLKEQTITEKQHLEVLSHIKGIQFVNMGDFSNYDLSAFALNFNRELLEELMVLPIVYSMDSYVIAYCEKSPDNAQTILREKLGINIMSAFTTDDMVTEGIKRIYENKEALFKTTDSFRLLNKDKISAEQYIIVCNYAINQNRDPDEVLKNMGLYEQQGMVE
jgi:adsorption protein B